MKTPDFDTYRRAARNIDDVAAWVTLHVPEFTEVTLKDAEFLRSSNALPWRCRSTFRPTSELRERLLLQARVDGIFHIGGAESFACHSDELVCDVTVSQWPCLASFVISAYMSNLGSPGTTFVSETDVREMIAGAFPSLAMEDLHNIHAMQSLTGLELSKWLQQFMAPAAPDAIVTLPLM